MKIILILLFAFSITKVSAQTAENIIIITTDGLRWQEVFGGMDSAIANKKNSTRMTVQVYIKNTGQPTLQPGAKNYCPFYGP